MKMVEVFDAGEYPEKFKWSSTADHLLFDLGFTFACLAHAKRLGKRLLAEPALDWAAIPLLRRELEDFLAKLDSLNRGRIQEVDKLYESAPEAAEKVDRAKAK